MTEVGKISVTDTADSFVFTSPVNITKIVNSGESPCYFNLNGDATINHFRLYPSDEIEIGLYNTTSVSAICDTGQTTTINIIGCAEW